jgi:hypothetical protein
MGTLSEESAANSDSGPAGLVTDERADDVRSVEVPGGRIAYEVMGQGPLIVLSHGIGDLRQWHEVAALRDRSCELATLPLPDKGSPTPRSSAPNTCASTKAGVGPAFISDVLFATSTTRPGILPR